MPAAIFATSSEASSSILTLEETTLICRSLRPPLSSRRASINVVVAM